MATDSLSSLCSKSSVLKRDSRSRNSSTRRRSSLMSGGRGWTCAEARGNWSWGYTKENVARWWTVDTGILLDVELPDEPEENPASKLDNQSPSLPVENQNPSQCDEVSHLHELSQAKPSQTSAYD
ncbi:unnamed protein product [Fraxinus pennsylvanica]|uniref:Uncharacterized protein n=1 Tax=Fraxinus pennsylvanica TaxID=56036 RepID=A0AAD2E7U2_9LAMI|nr:unnamed protein product [Fraxinus pennsylvanica]